MTADHNAAAREIALGRFRSPELTVGERLVADIAEALASAEDRARQEGRREGLEAASDCQPSTAENPNEDAYQRGRFDGIMEYGRAIRALATGKE